MCVCVRACACVYVCLSEFVCYVYIRMHMRYTICSYLVCMLLFFLIFLVYVVIQVSTDHTKSQSDSAIGTSVRFVEDTPTATSTAQLDVTFAEGQDEGGSPEKSELLILVVYCCCLAQ